MLAQQSVFGADVVLYLVIFSPGSSMFTGLTVILAVIEINLSLENCVFTIGTKFSKRCSM